jgi:hypothetical protein
LQTFPGLPEALPWRLHRVDRIHAARGLERHSKLILAWHLGRRTTWDAHDFMEKLARARAYSN